MTPNHNGVVFFTMIAKNYKHVTIDKNLQKPCFKKIAKKPQWQTIKSYEYA